VYPPTLADFVDVAQAAYCARDLVDMERALLRELGFTLAVPTAATFLSLYLPAAAANAADADALLSAAIDGDADGAAAASPAGSSCSSGSAYGGGSLSGSLSSLSSAGSLCSAGSGGLSSASSGGGGASGRLPPADAPTGPRAAPCYPYPVGGPLPVAKGGARPAASAPARGGPLSEFPRRVAHMAEYLAELSLLTPECLAYPPSLVAAASLHLACALLDAPPGARARLAPAAEGAVARSGPGGAARLRACVAELRRMYAYAARAPRPPAVKSKYSAQRRAAVAALPVPRWALEP
jgi:hypothetical protein